MNLIRITPDNLATEHICCAITDEKDPQVAAKKSWMAERLSDGLVFLKGDVRGKCFIEYIPAEKAWAPLEADGYNYIDCLWVSGQYKGHGYSSVLLDECIRDSKSQGKKGLVIISSKKKLGFLADYKYLSYKGFETVDRAEPYFELMSLAFSEGDTKPRFKSNMKKQLETLPAGFVICYTNQCPFTEKYVPLLQRVAAKRNAPLAAIHIKTLEQAQSAPTPYTTFGLFFNRQFVTHEIQSEKKFEKLLLEKGF